MKFLPGRRFVLRSASLFMACSLFVAPAWAAQSAKDFVNSLGTQLVTIVNSPISLPEKREKVLPLLQKNVDIDAIARYCLGRYWKVATPEEQKEYLQLFHQTLVGAITDKLGDYRGVSFSIGAVTSSGNEDSVETTLVRPQQPPAKMQWIVSRASGSEKVVDVIGEGASLRMTQRQDYASYIARNGGKVSALISALKRQIANHSAAQQ
ncbi:toluene transporter [Acetobacter sp. DmW_043]|uniref:MlaC/ttg2D family ABC transporter substrate-binding protein n=1 Tax=Acetobacter sp. DmW_043 TaxID=1670658 RepID=UPI000A3CDDBC|nr:ABC transporter substrate-binding protein [Acetobacter sp. DmW_043]OUI87805.1 toluene transporter [Acetobacter sp. DmW_043]